MRNLALGFVLLALAFSACNGEEPPPSPITLAADVSEAAQLLLGTWAWEGGTQYEYVFHADGSGVRGTADHLIAFTWRLDEDDPDHLIIHTEAGYESWTYLVTDTIFLLISRQVENFIFTYVRVPE